MASKAYYNEFDKKAAAMLRQLIKNGIIADGDVDERSILEVTANDLKGYTQCHFFAGIGGWSIALKLAGWPDDKPVWTGSCPCQPFSSAGKGEGKEDERHLWPAWNLLIKQYRDTIGEIPSIYGEQVSTAIRHGWLDGVYADLEAQNYAIASAVLPACSVNAPHKRDRLWFVAHSEGERALRGSSESSGEARRPSIDDSNLTRGTSGLSHGNMANASGERLEGSTGQSIQRGGEGLASGGSGALGDAEFTGSQGQLGHGSTAQGRQGARRSAASTGFWSDFDWIICGDGKARRIPSVESGIRIVSHGLQHRASRIHALGNAIVPQVAAKFIQASM